MTTKTEFEHLYPYDYGAMCKAHAEPGYSSCSGDNPADWCDDPWCYVDPCTCNGFALAASDYFEGSGVSLFYSYAVCGSSDDYNIVKCTAITDEVACNAEDECTYSSGSCQVDLAATMNALEEVRTSASCPPLYGNPACPCIQDNGQTIVDNTVITDKAGFSGHAYPFDYGEQCTAHAEPGVASCSDPFPPAWCGSAWCYIDPCNCNDENVGLSDYFTTTASGKPLYFSYATCGSLDTYSGGVCLALGEVACGDDPDCSWSDNACSSAAGTLAAAQAAYGNCEAATVVPTPVPPTVQQPATPERSPAEDGTASCICIGSNGQQHNADGTVTTTKATFSGHLYPGDYGESCKPHAEPGQDDCQGDSPRCSLFHHF